MNDVYRADSRKTCVFLRARHFLFSCYHVVLVWYHTVLY
eukprot:CCRYP_014833-RA/>CCRYP_014833-RA protein AED:0.47 eAED:0.47 QI:157/1/1/1/0/0/2/0/38